MLKVKDVIGSLVFVSITAMLILLHWSGYFGFGHDFHAAYHQNNLNWGGVTDRLGFLAATLTVWNTHVGIVVVGLALTWSAKVLVNQTGLTHKNSIHFYILYILILFSWPYFMSFSNAMRQGLAMSFLCVALINYYNFKKRFILFLFISIFLHKAAIFIALAGIVSVLACRYLGYNIVAAIAFGVSLCLIIVGFFSDYKDKIIGLDLSLVWCAIGLCWIAVSVWLVDSRKSMASPFLAIIVAISYVFSEGLIWQVERLFMMTVFPMIFVMQHLFVNTQKLVFLYLTCLTFVILTYLTGMYSSYY